MIITVTLNPAIDRIMRIDNFHPGDLNRVTEVIIRPGGKGINVARVVHQIGQFVLTTGIIGGETGEAIINSLHKKDIKTDFVFSNYLTRQNTKIIEEAGGKETEINEPGRASLDDFGALEEKLKKYLYNDNIFVLAGSIPEGLSAGTYNDIVKLCKDYSIPVMVDTSGENLREVLKEEPFLIKPNLDEAEEIVGRKLDNKKDIKYTVDFFLDKGIKIVTISMGSQGAVFADANNCFYSKTPQVNISNTTVGAGDSMVAGLAVGLQNNLSLKEMAHYASAVATTYVKMGKVELITADEIEKIKNLIKVNTI